MGLKRLAAERAVQFIEDDFIIGLGTGSSSDEVLHCIAELIKERCFANLRGVPTSIRTENLSRELGLELCDLSKISKIDLTIDGTDQFDSNLNLLKGHGGALTREKIVAQQSSRYIVVADSSKRVEKLGERCTLPVEVLQFGWTRIRDEIQAHGAKVEIRIHGSERYLTDQHNFILDCAFEGGIEDPHKLARELKLITGVVEHGLFLDMADLIIVASDSGIEILERDET